MSFDAFKDALRRLSALRARLAAELRGRQHTAGIEAAAAAVAAADAAAAGGDDVDADAPELKVSRLAHVPGPSRTVSLLCGVEVAPDLAFD
jgi:hypothetical protein